jgi:hypothetical protein
LEVGGPWEGRGSETAFPSIHNLAQSMASKHHLMKKRLKKIYNSSLGLQPSPLALQHEYIL